MADTEKPKREHEIEVWDQTIGCAICGHAEWMDDSLPDECPGPPEKEKKNG